MFATGKLCVLVNNNLSRVQLCTLTNRISVKLKAVAGNTMIIPAHNAATKADVERNVEKFKKDGSFENSPKPGNLEHFRTAIKVRASHESKDSPYTLPHPIWTDKELADVTVTHKEPEGKVDKLAFYAVKMFRFGFDVLSGFNYGERTERKWINRICFLETVAGVPGMVAAMTRHLNSLRRMERDHGWIHTLLEEAENERMHLMTALQLRQPSLFFRLMVMGAQGAFVTMFSFSYLLSPRFCHRFVGYLEEEAVITYTKCLEDIDSGRFEKWKTLPAPEISIKYWKLPPDATMRDVVLVIRADEAHHRLVNHTLGSMDDADTNPYKPGK